MTSPAAELELTIGIPFRNGAEIQDPFPHSEFPWAQDAGVNLSHLLVKPPKNEQETPVDPTLYAVTAQYVADFSEWANANKEHVLHPVYGWFGLYKTKSEVAESYVTHRDAVRSTINIAEEEGQYVIVGYPEMGAVTMRDFAQGYIREDLMTTEKIVGGTRGTVTGMAAMGELHDRRIVRPDHFLVFADDVLDSGNTAHVAALERRRVRLGYEDGQEIQDSMFGIPERVRVLWKEREKLEQGALETDGMSEQEEQVLNEQLMANHQNMENVYAEAAQLMEEEQVVVGCLYWKNQYMIDALQQRVTQQPDSTWARMQQTMLNAVIKTDKNKWITGAQGPLRLGMFDIGMMGEDMRKGYMDEEYHEHVKRLGFDGIEMRIMAGAEDLLIFRQNRADNFLRFFALGLQARLREAYPNEFEATIEAQAVVAEEHPAPAGGGVQANGANQQVYP